MEKKFPEKENKTNYIEKNQVLLKSQWKMPINRHSKEEKIYKHIIKGKQFY